MFVADIVDVGIDCVEEPKIVGAAPLPVELEPKISVDDLALPLPEVAAVSDSVPDAAVLETDGAAPVPVVELKLNIPVDDIALLELVSLSVPVVGDTKTVGIALLIV